MNADRRRVLFVEHGSNRGGLAAARSLARAGWTVDLVASGTGLTRRSSAVRTVVDVDYPGCGADGLVAAVARAARERGSELILPVDETQLLILSERRHELPAVVPYPPHAVLERVTDRYENALAAEAAGLAPPRTQLAADARLDDERATYVVKARRPQLHRCGQRWSRFETTIGGPQAAAAAITTIQAAGCEAIVQELITGPLMSLSVLTGPDGRVIGRMQQAAERIWPAGAGTSARARTVAVDEDLSSRAVDLFGRLGWHGLAQLQFLVDATGQRRLIDFNPRFYGSLALAIGAGVDFPALWAAAATGSAEAAPAMRPGVRYHWAGGDLRRALSERQGGLVRDVASTLAWSFGAVHPVWSIRDPRPATSGWSGLLRRGRRNGHG